MQELKYALVGCCLLGVLLAWPGKDAHACGGCVAPPGTFSAVDSHRMVIKLGIEESILWDQFIYSGAPEEFAWILPVPTPETVVEIADVEFIDVIDQETSPIVLSPPCGEASGGCDGGCGGPRSFPNLADEVTVHKRELVGPYETVVIGAEDPRALYAWLGQEGYAFPDSGLPTLDYYTERGSSFVVLRLQPGLEVSAMRPVRVRFRGYMGQFPLRMISLGVLESVELSLWVIAEGRYAPENFASRTMDPRDIRWDWATETSNYQEAFEQSIATEEGFAWITEYAGAMEGSAVADALGKDAPIDLAMATAGIHAPTLTRLRTKLPVGALEEDLVLGLASDQSNVQRTIVAAQVTQECLATEPAGLLPPTKDGRVQALFWLLAAGAIFGLRRRAALLRNG